MARSVSIPRYLTIIFSVLLVLSGIFVGVLEFIGRATGSTMLPRQLAKMQAEQPQTMIMPGELNFWAAYKLARIADAKPDIILISSSRGGELRSAMFMPYRFYNASFTAWNLQQITEMVDRITRVSKPRVIIVGLDYYMFTNRYADGMEGRNMYFDRELFYRYKSLRGMLKVITDRPAVFDEKIYPEMTGRSELRFDGLKPIGIHALINEAGFRWDGSFRYSAGQLSQAQENIKENVGLIKAVPGGSQIDPRQFAELEKLAALARERGVLLVAIQFPFWKASVDFIDGEPSYHYMAGVWREFRSAKMNRKFQELGILFFDLCCGPISSDSRNFIDAAHPGERASLSALINLYDDPEFRAIFPAADIEKLVQDFDDAQKKDEYFNVYHNRY